MNEYIPEIGITDTRNIINVVKELHNYDFSNYALTSFKRMLEKVIYDNNLKTSETLILKLKNDKSFLDIFLKQVTVEETEMFRDPSLWRMLRDEILPSTLRDHAEYKIWLPISSSGDDLYTLCIMLKEIGVSEKVKIFCSYYSEKILNSIKNGDFNPKKIEISEQNYHRYQGKHKFSDFFTIQQQQMIRDSKLLKNTHFIKQGLHFSPPPTANHMVIFRNQMLYYNASLKDTIMDTINESILPGGYLIIGIKENLKGVRTENKFAIVSDIESIYKKKI